ELLVTKIAGNFRFEQIKNAIMSPFRSHLLPLSLPIILIYFLYFYSFWERRIRRKMKKGEAQGLVDSRFACVAALALDLSQIVAAISVHTPFLSSSTFESVNPMSFFFPSFLFLVHYSALFFLSTVELKVSTQSSSLQRLWDTYFALLILF